MKKNRVQRIHAARAQEYETAIEMAADMLYHALAIQPGSDRVLTAAEADVVKMEHALRLLAGRFAGQARVAPVLVADVGTGGGHVVH